MINSSRSAVHQTALLGILGGMGPLAHIEFERCLIENCVQRGANGDGDLPSWLLACASNIPDRTRSLQGEAESCAPWLIRYGRTLECAGADFLVVTCNTAHAFFDEVQPQIGIPWIRLMDATSQHIKTSFPQVRHIGILSTDGTLKSGLYRHSLLEAGLIPVELPLGSLHQTRVMQAIYSKDWGVKATGTWVSSRALDAFAAAVHHLQQQGAELVIAGCSEISVGFNRMKSVPLPWVDPLNAMAIVAIDIAYGHRTLHTVVAA